MHNSQFTPDHNFAFSTSSTSNPPNNAKLGCNRPCSK